MRTQHYPSDLTDEQWALVEPLIPVYPGGRPRITSMRDVLDAIFYLLRTGCQWKYLPKDFPPKSTVWGYFDEWVVSPSGCQPNGVRMRVIGIVWCWGTIATPSRSTHDRSTLLPSLPSSADTSSGPSPHAASAPPSRSCRCTA